MAEPPYSDLTTTRLTLYRACLLDGMNTFLVAGSGAFASCSTVGAS